MDRPFIQLAGLLGAGKTTLAEAISKELSIPIFYESVEENPLLGLFYQDRKKYGFVLQIDLLNRRMKQHKKIAFGGEGGVMDRSIYEDRYFAQMLYEEGSMSDEEYRTYLALSSTLFSELISPDAVVYLDVKPEVAHERLKHRGRECESSVPLSYLTQLKQVYDIRMKELAQRHHIIWVDWNEFGDMSKLARDIVSVVNSPAARITRIG